MAEMTATNRWTMRMVFVAIVALISFMQLLPLNPGPGRFPGPDLLLLVAIAWVQRRPEYVPVWLIALIFFIADWVFMRPPGLWAGIVVVATETLRAQAPQLRDQSIFIEWLTVAGMVTAMFLAYAMILGIFLVDQPALGATLIRLIMTILAYPLAIALSARAFGVRKMVGGETEQFGRVR